MGFGCGVYLEMWPESVQSTSGRLSNPHVKSNRSVQLVNEIISMLTCFFNPFKKAEANDVLYL